MNAKKVVTIVIVAVFIGVFSFFVYIWNGAQFVKQQAKEDAANGFCSRLQECQELLRKNPNDLHGIRGMYLITSLDGPFDQADVWIKRGLTVAPHDRFLLEKYALRLYKAGHRKEAISMMDDVGRGNDLLAEGARIIVKKMRMNLQSQPQER